jgi:hypothetical protein
MHDIASHIDVAAARFGLLRTHILNRPDHIECPRERCAIVEWIFGRFRDTEIDHFRNRPVRAFRHQNI